MKRQALICVAAVILGGLLSTSARAQTPSPLAQWQYSSGVPLEPRFEDHPPEWQALAGPGMLTLPAYPGAKSYRVWPSITFDVRYRDEVFMSDGEGLGMNLWRGGKAGRAGIAIAYDRGRDADDDGPLRNLGRIDPAPTAKMFADFVLFPVVLHVDIARIMGGADGWWGDLSAYMPVYGTSHFFVFVGPSLLFADDRLNQAYFGITPLQALSSGLRRYQASGGLQSVNFGVSATWIISDNWMLEGDAAVEELTGAASNSPITLNPFQGLVSLDLAYTF